MEWQPPSQGSLLPVLGTRLSGVGVRATEGVPLPALLDSPQLLHVLEFNKEFTQTDRRKYLQCRVNCFSI